MRKLLFLLMFWPSLALAGGPRNTYQTPPAPAGLNDEISNIYHDLQYPIINFAQISSETVKVSSITTLSIGANLNANSYKITNLANGSAATDAAAFGQIPTAKVIQYVTASSASDFSTSNTTYQSTTLTANITPTSASNKVLVCAYGALRSPGASIGSQASLFNGSTDLLAANGGPQIFFQAGISTNIQIVPWSACWLDSPASASQQTYTVKLRNTNTAGTVLFTDEQFMILIELS